MGMNSKPATPSFSIGSRTSFLKRRKVTKSMDIICLTLFSGTNIGKVGRGVQVVQPKAEERERPFY
jgi:hypothetical protein